MKALHTLRAAATRLRRAIARRLTPPCIAAGKHDWGTSCNECGWP